MRTTCIQKMLGACAFPVQAITNSRSVCCANKQPWSRRYGLKLVAQKPKGTRNTPSRVAQGATMALVVSMLVSGPSVHVMAATTNSSDAGPYIMLQRQRIERVIISEFSQRVRSLSDEELGALLEKILASRTSTAPELLESTERQQRSESPTAPATSLPWTPFMPQPSEPMPSQQPAQSVAKSKTDTQQQLPMSQPSGENDISASAPKPGARDSMPDDSIRKASMRTEQPSQSKDAAPASAKAPPSPRTSPTRAMPEDAGNNSMRMDQLVQEEEDETADGTALDATRAMMERIMGGSLPSFSSDKQQQQEQQQQSGDQAGGGSGATSPAAAAAAAAAGSDASGTSSSSSTSSSGTATSFPWPWKSGSTAADDNKGQYDDGSSGQRAEPQNSTNSSTTTTTTSGSSLQAEPETQQQQPSFPGLALPGISLPSVTLPELPNISLPQLPSISLPDLPSSDDSPFSAVASAQSAFATAAGGIAAATSDIFEGATESLLSDRVGLAVGVVAVGSLAAGALAVSGAFGEEEEDKKEEEKKEGGTAASESSSPATPPEPAAESKVDAAARPASSSPAAATAVNSSSSSSDNGNGKSIAAEPASDVADAAQRQRQNGKAVLKDPKMQKLLDNGPPLVSPSSSAPMASPVTGLPNAVSTSEIPGATVETAAPPPDRILWQRSDAMRAAVMPPPVFPPPAPMAPPMPPPMSASSTAPPGVLWERQAIPAPEIATGTGGRRWWPFAAAPPAPPPPLQQPPQQQPLRVAPGMMTNGAARPRAMSAAAGAVEAAVPMPGVPTMNSPGSSGRTAAAAAGTVLPAGMKQSVALGGVPPDPWAAPRLGTGQEAGQKLQPTVEPMFTVNASKPASSVGPDRPDATRVGAAAGQPFVAPPIESPWDLPSSR